MRKLAFLVFLAMLSLIVGMTVTSKTGTNDVKFLAESPQSVPGNEVDAPGTIDGAKNPELIPDHVAYSAMFRLLSNRRTEDEINKVRAYVKQIGLGKHDCKVCPKEIDTADSDVDALLAAAEEFYQRVTVIDQQVAEIKDRTWPNPSSLIMTQLADLQKQKEAVATQIAS